MVREMCFRGKRIDNGEWVYGFLLICDERYLIIPETKIGCVTTEWLKKGEYAFYGFIEVDPATVGRYTGMPDKNGAKIFEGDIVHNGAGDPGVVVWIYGSFAIHFSDGEDWDVCQYVKEEYTEVIGNIYDNTDLILPKKEAEKAPAVQQRLIDANVLRAQCGPPHWCVWMSEIDDAPTVDAVEVVRCGECKNADPCTCVVCEDGATIVCPKIHRHMKKTDFCSYGDRKEGL